MVDQIIRPSALPRRTNPVASEIAPVDNGTSVAGSTLAEIVNAGRPVASRSEAEAGANAEKAMTPLTVDQKIEYEIGRSLASKAQGDKADSAIQEIVEGANTTVDNTDPQRPIVSSSGNPSVGFKSDIVVVDGQTDWRVARNYKTVSDLLADNGSGPTGMGYAGSGANVIVSSGDTINAEGFRYETAPSDASDFSIESIASVKVIARNEFVTPAMFGMIDGSSTAQHEQFAKACKAAIEDDIPLQIRGEYVLDHVDLSGVAAGGNLRIEHAGKLIHVDGSSDHMFAFGARDYLEIVGPGEFDGQKDEQTQNRLIIPVDQIQHFYLRGSTFRNVKQGAVWQRSSAVGQIFVMEQFRCFEGSLHDGIVNSQSCYFVRISGGKLTRISDFRMVQTADPLPNQNRNPAGIFMINTSPTGIVGEQVIIERGYLENLGHHCEGNAVGCVDFYNRFENVTLRNLRIRKPRLLPIRLNYASTIDVSGCDIVHASQAIIDGGANYTDESCISITINDRGYATDFGDINTVSVRNNRITVVGDQNCNGVAYTNQQDNDALMRSAVSSGNVLTSDGTNSGDALYVGGVSNFLSEGDDIRGFTTGARVQGTSRSGSTVSASMAKATFRDGRMLSKSVGVFARSQVTNLDLTIDNQAIAGQSGLTYTARNANNVRVLGSTLSNAGDAQSNVAFWYRDNTPGTASDPAGYTTNTYYRLRDNQGRNDQASA